MGLGIFTFEAVKSPENVLYGRDDAWDACPKLDGESIDGGIFNILPFLTDVTLKCVTCVKCEISLIFGTT